MRDQSMPKEIREDIINALLKGRKIEAIKIYRESMGVGLKEAKIEIESMVEELKEEYPELAKTSGRGCATTSIVLLCACVFLYWFF